MRYLSLIILIVFSKVSFAQEDIPYLCVSGIHDYYQFLLLVEPNLQTLDEKNKKLVLDKKAGILKNIKEQCPAKLSSKLQDITKGYDVKSSEFLRYFKQDVGVNVPLIGEKIPLELRNLTDKELKLWAASTVLNAYDIPGIEFQGFEHLRKNFNANAYEKIVSTIYNNYLKSYSYVDSAKNIKIRDKQFNLSASIISIPKINFQSKNESGQYEWRVTVPMLIEIRASDRVRKEKSVVKVYVTRVESTVSEDGLAITSFEELN